jgi:hypothetical protein
VNHAFRQATSAPPSKNSQEPSLRLNQLWQKLPTETRKRALQKLHRIIAQQLFAPRIVEEVAHEQH